jgi:hypothetical protein
MNLGQILYHYHHVLPKAIFINIEVFSIAEEIILSMHALLMSFNTLCTTLGEEIAPNMCTFN